MTAVGINPRPTTPRKQLRAFYARQGLTGKQLRSAMRYDLRQLRKYAVEHNAGLYRECYGPMTDDIVYRHSAALGLGMGAMFLFCDTREGAGYWAKRSGY